MRRPSIEQVELLPTSPREAKTSNGPLTLVTPDSVVPVVGSEIERGLTSGRKAVRVDSMVSVSVCRLPSFGSVLGMDQFLRQLRSGVHA